MPSETTEKKVIEKRTIELSLKRENGVTKFCFSVDPFITAVYKSQHKEIKTSASWPGLEFYSVPSIIEGEAYKKMLAEFRLRDSFGSALYEGSGDGNGRLNIAWLRTVAGKGEIEVSDQLSIAEMSQLIKKTSSFIKEYFEEYFRECEIKGTITVNL